MANSIKDQTPHRSVLGPLQICETIGNQTTTITTITPSQTDITDLGKISGREIFVIDSFHFDFKQYNRNYR